MATDKYSSVIYVHSALQNDGNWLLRSSNLPGLLLCGKDLKKLHDDVPHVIKALFKLNFDMNVDVRANREPCEIQAHRKVREIKAADNWIAIPA